MDNAFRYVYYNKKTGKILSISTKDPNYEHGIKVPFNEVINLLTGKEKFRDYLIGYKKDSNGKTKLGLVPNSDMGFVFKNNVFEWITESSKNAECTVVWNNILKSWEFVIDQDVIDAYQDFVAQKLVFFVTLENDFDFLVRTIYIPFEDLLLSGKITVPFTTKLETKIDKISISSKMVFKSYNLRILHE